MTGRFSGIIMGLFPIILSFLVLEIEDQVNQPEVILYVLSAILTLAVVAIVFYLVRHRNHRQEN